MTEIKKIVKETVVKTIHGDRGIWTIIVFLSLISLAAVYSSSSSEAYRFKTSTISFLWKQLFFVAGGLTILYISYRIPLGIYRKVAIIAFWASLGLMALLPFFGKEVNGATRWIMIAGIEFQPSEIAKITTILFLARMFEKNHFKDYKDFLIKVVLPLGLMIILILLGSFSTAILMTLISFILMILASVKWEYIWKTALIVIGAFSLLLVIHQFTGSIGRLDTGIARIERFFTKESHQMSEAQRRRLEEMNYQSDKAKEAIAIGGVTGVGVGSGTSKIILPESNKDYIYAVIVEEGGLITGTILIFLYLALLSRCANIIGRCKKVFSAMVVAGISLLITTQAFLHIGVNVGLIPVTGHSLPLISLGGTSFWIMSGAFGIILSVSRTLETSVKKVVEVEDPNTTQS